MSRKNRANAMWFRKECFFVTRRVAVRETSSCSLRNDLLLGERKRAEK